MANNGRIRKEEDDSRTIPEWREEAEELLNEQPDLHEKLANAMKSAPPSGLYPGERPEDFPTFVQHVRTILSRSPRTILRQTVDSDEKIGDDLKELRLMLDLRADATLHTIAQTMENLTKGNCYRRLENAKEQLENNFRSEVEGDDDDLKTMVANGLARKRASTPTSAEIKQALDRAVAKKHEQRKRLQEQAHSLEELLEEDPEYNRFCKATKLWKECGGENLWNNYKSVNLAISKCRRGRGSRFEVKCSNLVSAMIVTRLSKENDSHDMSYSDYWCERGMYLWSAGQAVGELDIVVHHKERGVVAFCEMKSACFEIAIAPRQHAEKLDAVAKNHGAWAIGKTMDEAVSVSGQRIPLFLATLMPSEENSGQLGAEPQLANVICEGIRLQGKRIVHASNLHLCFPLIAMLKDKSRLEDAVEYLESLPSSLICPHDENDLDYEQLRRFVLENMGPEQLVESPVGCLESFPKDQMFVLPRSLVA